MTTQTIRFTSRGSRAGEALPPGSTDTHHHVFDDRFSGVTGQQPPEATAADYARLRDWVGFDRSVIVAPSTYGTDNRCLLDALEVLGNETTRGVVIVDPEVSDSTLRDLHAKGVRGIRIYLTKNRIPTAEEMQLLGRRAADLGWVVQIVGGSSHEAIPRWEPVLAGLPCPVVIDHLGWAPQPRGEHSATAESIYRLLDNGHTYAKISGFYLSSTTGPPSYADVAPLAKNLCARAPERLLWGTDWPHPGALQKQEPLPDDAALVRQLWDWLADPADLVKILVDNPDALFWSD